MKGVTLDLRDRVYEFTTGIIDWQNKYYRELRVRLLYRPSFGFQPGSTTIMLLAPDKLPTSDLEIPNIEGE